MKCIVNSFSAIKNYLLFFSMIFLHSIKIPLPNQLLFSYYFIEIGQKIQHKLKFSQYKIHLVKKIFPLHLN